MARDERLDLSSAAELAAWMEREYLSEITLDELEPSPGTATDRVRFEWTLHAGGPRTPYRIEARGVTRWSIAGERDAHAIGILPPRTVNDAIELVMEVPGRLTLVCTGLTITRGRRRKNERAPRPFTDYAYFTAIGLGALDAEPLRRALSDEITAELASIDALRTGGPLALRIGTRVICTLHWAPTREHGWLSVARRDASDAEWHRCQALPSHLPAERIGSAWELDATPDEWLRIVGRADRAARRPRG
jgi:hypothetical protein